MFRHFYIDCSRTGDNWVNHIRLFYKLSLFFFTNSVFIWNSFAHHLVSRLKSVEMKWVHNMKEFMSARVLGQVSSEWQEKEVLFILLIIRFSSWSICCFLTCLWHFCFFFFFVGKGTYKRGQILLVSVWHPCFSFLFIL